MLYLKRKSTRTENMNARDGGKNWKINKTRFHCEYAQTHSYILVNMAYFISMNRFVETNISFFYQFTNSNVVFMAKIHIYMKLDFYQQVHRYILDMSNLRAEDLFYLLRYIIHAIIVVVILPIQIIILIIILKNVLMAFYVNTKAIC